ncbi:sigma 54-interacting transcriptional regulator [Clostridium cadaveris]|uniref:sigma-54 interaction domain-containing protein n=1 Tax=Clostridium cadaveris TaxID=1529 RepID=UPI001E4F81B8|nr:sigma 54-interacting transcriptional regulator [Clostridium cadaveris]UFH65962.1 sigma 54-interacting transcriptional regulator [Clostridium cadaveris]
MFNLEDVRPSIEKLVLAISDCLKLEVAIFDERGTLFYCTPTYLKKKGSTVHTKFIRDVLNNGSILVNTPGDMPSCIGCRFREHCPSTIEILCSIRANTSVIGVADFTSFTKEGQRRISKNNPVYLDAIKEMADLIGEYVLSKSGALECGHMDYIINDTLEISKDPLILTDQHGVIIQGNNLAYKLLKLDEGSLSIRQIFSKEIAEDILNGANFFEKNVSMGKFSVKITTKPIVIDNKRIGTLVRFADEINEKLQIHSFNTGIVGESKEMKELKKLIKKLADSPTPVLITGETGTGKELIAKSIHNASKRSKYPFVAINCSSIPENLFESELFGYSGGSFTGARKEGKIGKIEMAQGGTLFLDELGEMPLSAQPKLLRVLQEYELERVGSSKKIPLDIRVIAATNCKLEEMINKGKFRQDLFYRIAVINIKIPPLRQRKGDIIPIAYNYIEKIKEKLETPLDSISPEVENLFLNYNWPGNIRELQNVVEYAANLCEDKTMTINDLPDTIFNQTMISKEGNKECNDLENEKIKKLLDQYGYTLEGKKQIAKILGISLRTLYRRINGHNANSGKVE